MKLRGMAWVRVLVGAACGVGLMGVTVAVNADTSSEQTLRLAEQAFAQSDFSRTIVFVEPFLGDPVLFRAFCRLHMLSLVRLGKTAEGLEAYDRFVDATGREDDRLLRELALHSILPLRSDMRVQVRGAAYSALKEVSSDDVVPYFYDGLRDGSGMIRVLVAEGMGKFPVGRHSAVFRKALNDQAGLVQVTVLNILGRSGDVSAVPLIIPLLKDEQTIVKVAAAAALYQLGQHEYWQNVERAATVAEGYERGAALRMLGDMGDPRGLPLLTQGLRDTQPSIRAAAASSLGKLGLAEGIPPLIAALSEPVPAVRSVVAVTLGRLEAEQARSALTLALRDANKGVRAAAVAGLLQLHSPFRVVAGTVRELMEQHNPGLRSSVAKALGHGRARDVVAPLLILLEDPVSKPRISAVRSLGRVGGRKLIPHLTTLMRDANESVRATAAGALARILSVPSER